MSTATIISVPDRETWLEARTRGIGASEVAAAIGLSDRKSPLELYLEKTGQKPRQKATIPMRAGNFLEPLLAELYQEETGRELIDQQVFYRGEERPHLLATIDALTEDRVVEFKTTTDRNKDFELDADNLPETWQCQVQQQMYLAEKDRADVAVLVNWTQFHVIPVFRNDDLIAAMLPHADEFWRCVETRTEPTSRPGDGELYQYLPAVPDTITLHDQAQAWADEYHQISGECSGLDKRKKELRGLLLDAIGPFEAARLPDGRLVSRKVSQRKGYVVEPSTQVRLVIGKGMK